MTAPQQTQTTATGRWSEAQADTNSAALDAALDGLAYEQMATLHSHLLGGLLGHVDTRTFADILAAASAFTVYADHPDFQEAWRP